MSASSKVVFYMGGDNMSAESQWPPTLTTPTPPPEQESETTSITPITPTTPITPITSTLRQQVSQDDIWAYLTMKLQNMNPSQLFRLIGF